MSFENKLQKNKKLADYSTFGIGGEALFFLDVFTLEEMQEAFSFIQKEGIPYFILGRGSNILFDDRGFSGLVICNKIDFANYQHNCIEVGSGKSFVQLGRESVKKGLSGLEFAAGVPGSVGGAIFMNASANGQELKNVLKKVCFLTLDGKLQELKCQDLQFSYRKSIFQTMQGAVISANFELIFDEKALENQKIFLEKKQKSQPLDAKSAGCVFRNLEKISAGAIIDQCGLKGKKIGGAVVSPIHANFIVNEGKATAKDVLALIALVQERVKEQTGQCLNLEIKYVPFSS